MTCNLFKTRMPTYFAVAALAVSGVAVAGDETDGANQQSQNMDAERWQELREQTVSAEELLGADVATVDDPVGNVRDLVLNESGTAVEYVLYEVPYPYAYGGNDDGFASFDNLAVDDFGGFGIRLRFDDDAAAKAPDELILNRQQADHRLVSNILDETVVFSGQETRPVEDILIDRQSGEIKGYVVNANQDAWFNDEPRVIAPDQVTVSDEGEVSTRAEFAALESLQ